MKRNLLLLVLLIGAAALVYYLVKHRSSGTLNVNEQAFAVADTAAVHRIFIADMLGHKVDLTRSQDGWVLNGRQPASKEAVNLMLSTLNRLAVRSPVTDAARPNVVREMAATHRKVMLYDKRNRLLKTIYIGHSTTDHRGNFMLVEGSQNPYVVEVPGFAGTLETRFITDTLRIRDAAIINLPYNAVESISVVYRTSADSSFAIDLSRDTFRVFNPVTNVELPHRRVDRNKVFAYVNLLKRVNAEAFETHNPTRAEILAQRPFAVVAVARKGGGQTVIECYDKPADRRSKSQFDPMGNPVQFDIDRFYGLVNGHEFVLLQHYHFGQVLKSLDYFDAAAPQRPAR